MNITINSSPNLWHKRLGHISKKKLQIFVKKNFTSLVKDTSFNLCDYCLFGKQYRVLFDSPSVRKENILERVYSYTCGPLEVESFERAKYFVTFIDDAFRKVWVYLLKTKKIRCFMFQNFHAIVEREIGKSLKCLRSNNGEEYTSQEFRDYCSKHRIWHKKTVPSTPQHHGVAEQMNHTIIERVRSMLKAAKLLKAFMRSSCPDCMLPNQQISISSFEVRHSKESMDSQRYFLFSYEGI